jgi:RHS repeat-associated protein
VDQLTVATYRTTDPTPTILQRYRYVYDAAGNRTAEQIGDAVTGASYDNMNRLTNQQPGGAMLFGGTVSEAATVAIAGKPASVSATNQFSGGAPVPSGTSQVTVQATDASGNVRTNTYELTQGGTSGPFAYDANGNLCAKDGTTCANGTTIYEWDAENRLTAAKEGVSTLAAFTYDGNGRRATKTASGETTTYVYDGAQFLEERPISGSARRYVYGFGIDQPLAQIAAGTTTYDLANHLGSIVRATDALGAPTLTRQYDPWGNPIQGSITSGYAFTGREWDSEAGLYYYRARFYSPSLARFISEDPLRLNGGINLYRYGTNEPIGHIDPSGTVEGSAANRKKRDAVDRIARGYDGRGQWRFDVAKDEFPPNTNKCNEFVCDVTREAGAAITYKSRCPRAGWMANTSVITPDWRVLRPEECMEPGDVAAYSLPGGGVSFSGHSGIITSSGNISAHADAVYQVPGQFENNPRTVYRRYTGN